MIAETDAAAPDTPAGEESDIGPRMVRTVVVKPDGTIVSSEATGVDEDGNALPQPEESDVVAVALPDPTRTQMDAVLEGGDLAVNPDPLSQPEPVEEPTAVAETPAASEPIPEPPSEPGGCAGHAHVASRRSRSRSSLRRPLRSPSRRRRRGRSRPSSPRATARMARST